LLELQTLKTDEFPYKSLPDIFPNIGPATRMVLLADFSAGRMEPTPQSWEAESTHLIAHGLAGLAMRVIRDRSLQIPPSVAEQIRTAAFNQMTSTAFVVNKSQAGLNLLHSRGIPFVITKGPGIAARSKSLSDRPFMDLDIVVKPSDFLEAYRLLSNVGYKEDLRSTLPWDSLNRLCREATNLRSEGGGSIDLHHRISPWYWSSGLSLESLRESASFVEVFGVPLPVASAEYNLLVASLHVVSDKSSPGQTYHTWRDLLVLANSGQIESIVEIAQKSGLAGWLTWILNCLPAEVQPSELLEGLSSKRQRLKGGWRLKMLLPPRLGSQHQLGQVFRLPVANATLFGAGMVVPSLQYLQHRYPNSNHPYLTWWRALPDNFAKETREREPTIADRPSLGGTTHRDEVTSTQHVTVIVPTRNRSEILTQTLHSILNQQDVLVSIIVVDDASTDDTKRVVLAVPDILLVSHDQPTEQRVARNDGARLATSDWIAFCDDDDLWAPNKLSRQLDALTTSGADWCTTSAIYVDEQLRPVGGHRLNDTRMLANNLQCQNTVPGGCSGVLMRRSIFEQAGGFRPEARYVEDWDLWKRLSQIGKAVCVDELLVGYRQWNRSFSHSAFERQYEAFCALTHASTRDRQGRLPKPRGSSAFEVRQRLLSESRASLAIDVPRLIQRDVRDAAPILFMMCLPDSVLRQLRLWRLGKSEVAIACEWLAQYRHGRAQGEMVRGARLTAHE